MCLMLYMPVRCSVFLNKAQGVVVLWLCHVLSFKAWSDAFRSSPDLTGVVTVYEDLRRKGVQFPINQSNGCSPIQTPNRVQQIHILTNQILFLERSIL